MAAVSLSLAPVVGVRTEVGLFPLCLWGLSLEALELAPLAVPFSSAIAGPVGVSLSEREEADEPAGLAGVGFVLAAVTGTRTEDDFFFTQ